jgi:hypothetical protein
MVRFWRIIFLFLGESEKFKVMFNSGMKEANEEKIEIKHIRLSLHFLLLLFNRKTIQIN